MSMFKEYLIELSQKVLASYKERATPEIVQQILKGNKAKAVHRAKGVTTAKEKLKEETDLEEMSRDTLKSYLKKRTDDITQTASTDALRSGTQIKPGEGTVIGLDPVTKKPIYKKEHPKYKEDKKIVGMKRAIDRL